MNKIARFSLPATLILALLSSPARAKSYTAVPGLEGQNTKLKIKFVKYTGGATGKMVVKVKNTGKHGARFKARGLYFVPNGDPESAPQRLGAAGPYEVEEQGKWRRTEDMMIPPGAERELRLQVFCIDSHRSSPGNKQGFQVARERMPAELRSKISSGAKAIIKKNKGKVDSANSEIQGYIWETRDKKWIKLQGERKQEKSPRLNRSSMGNSLPQAISPQQGEGAVQQRQSR